MQDRSPGNVRDPDCPSRQLFDLVTARWATLVLVDLAGGPLRWSELRRRAGGVSDKMLAQTLRDLESAGLVDRRVLGTRPPAVEYALTGPAHGVVRPLAEVQSWAEQNTAGFVEHREASPVPPRR